MKNYKLEEMVLWNEYNNSERIQRYKEPYKYGKDFSREEKIEFIDKYLPLTYKGKQQPERFGKDAMTYLMNLYAKYNAEKDSLPKAKYGGINTNSFKAWLRKNDPRGMHSTYHVGQIYFLTDLYIGRDIVWDERYGRQVDVVEHIFQIVLNQLAQAEHDAFAEVDPIAVGINKIREYNGKYGSLNNLRISSIAGNGLSYLEKSWMNWTKYKPVTLEEINKILSVYARVEEVYNKFAEEVNNDSDIVNDFDEFSTLGKSHE